MEKKNQILFIVVGVLLVIVIGVTFAYFTTGVTIEGSGGSISGETAELMKVKYDAGTSTLNADNLTPGHSATKGFKVTITPGSDTSTATYRIYLNITENTFTKCNDANYDDITNACAKGAEELIYRLKDSNGNILKTGDLTGITGEVELIRETKTAVSQTDYNYTLEIEFKETNADQNHNQNKTINGEVKVEFAERIITKEDILASLTKATRPNFETLTENTTGTIYQAEDDDGTSYYYAGAVDNNLVKFAGLYWRIIRFNGDGTIRLIYNGTNATATGEGTQISNGSTTKFAFNSTDKNNMYLGYRYTEGEVHGTKTASTIQGVVDSWYKTNLIDTGYSNKVDTNAGFCGDRTAYTDTNGTTSGGGTGTTVTYYGAFIRFRKGNTNLSNPTPTLKCPDKANDLYTVSSANKGNKSLTYPVGLITADEVGHAGAIYGIANSSYYLYTNQVYWTMSPSDYPSAYVFVVDNVGKLTNPNVNNTYGIRPVINLKANTLFIEGGNGTSSNPYVVLN